MGHKISEADQARLQELKANREYTRREILEICELALLSDRRLPGPDYIGAGGELLWDGIKFRQWLRDGNAIQCRARLATGIQRRRATLAGPHTWNDADRTVTARIASETPATVFSPEHFDYVDEILLAEGFVVDGESVPVLADHERTTDATVGRAYDFRQSGDSWDATLEFGDNKIADKVRDGFLDAVSIGYMSRENVTIQPGETAMVNGRSFTAGQRPLVVSTEWQVYEISVVPIGADPTARIRSQSFRGRRERIMSTAIHSRTSITGRMNSREAAASFLTRAGVDASRHLSSVDPKTGALVPFAEREQQRAAETAEQ